MSSPDSSSVDGPPVGKLLVGELGGKLGGLRLPAIVNQTMNTASNSATSASRIIHVIAMLSSVAALCTLVGSCATVPGPTRPGASGGAAPAAEPAGVLFRAVPFSALPGWSDDTPSAALPSFAASCRALIARSESAATWRRACAAASAVATRDDVAARAFFEAQFTPYEVTTADGIDVGRVTGYYEPMLKGSRARNDRYRYPLYAPPDDLVTVELGEIFPELKSERVRGRLDGKRVVPYWARAEIDAGQARLSGRELVWLDDPIEAFFVHIQGSARIELADRSSIRVGYADQNGHPYRSIGRALIERGELTLDKASMQGIKAWGRQHPDKLPSLLAENPSYVFFREIAADPVHGIDGPIGALGVPLAAGRAIAVDARFLPLGAPVFLATTYPLSDARLQRLVLAQDTGGAIRGALRADYFWGSGDDAGRNAGRMNQTGRIWLLWPNDAAPPGVIGRR
ncbi:MAG TPA: murein transglycosylase A [Casimicrobiaceae bacterium]|nr:murein transglycosylase A [Casimicrobiaceae bacterium]